MAIRWICPRDGDELTDVAVHYVWSAEPDAKEYTVEYSYDPEFSSPVSESAEPLPNACRWGALIPADGMLPHAGDVYARVKADEGDWSQVLHFSVNEAHTHAPLLRKIDPEHPYFILTDYSQHEWRAPWDLLPERVKPFASIGSMGVFESDNDTQREALMALDDKGLNWHLYAYGPHESDAGKYSCTPLCDVESILKHQKNLQSLVMVEQYLGRHPESYHHAVYMRRLIVLCGKYGMNFIYSDGNRNNIEMPPFFNSETARVMRDYAEYCTVLFKQNHSHAAYTVYGAILGGWESNVCGNIGVQSENWYWNDAGFRGKPGASFGYLQGIEQQIPPSFSVEMMLTGLSMGGCVYSLEGQGWLLECEDAKKPRWSRHGRAIMTLFCAILDQKLIPEKAEVMQKLHAMLKCDLSCEEQGDAWTGGVWRKAFDPIYRDPEGFALLMKNSRYFVLPIANRFTQNDLPIFPVEEITESDQLPRLIDRYYPTWADGSCYMTQVAGTTVVMNSQENLECAQSFDIPVNRGPVKRVSGAVMLWQYFVLRATDNGAVLMADGPEGSRIEIRVQSSCRLIPRADGNEILVENADETGLTITITPCGSPVMVELQKDAGETRLRERILPEDHPGYKWLSDIPFASVRTSGGAMPTKNICVNTRFGEMPLYMNGMTYVRGIGMTDGMEVTFDLRGEYAGLVMNYGFDIDAWMPLIIDRDRIVWDRYPRRIDLIFRVFADGSEIYASDAMKNTYVSGKARLDLKGVHQLKFTLYGEVHTATPEEIICFDIINPRLLSEEEFAAEPEQEESGDVMSGAFHDDMTVFQPQVQITTDNKGKLQTEYLDT